MLAAGCGEDVDPRAVARELQQPNQPELPMPVPQTANLAPGTAMPPPAPLGEGSTRRFELQQRRSCVVAIGRSVAEFLGADLEQQFEATHPEYDFRGMTVPDRDGVELMIGSKVEAAVVACPVTAREVRAGLRPQRLAAEVYVLAVPRSFPLRSLARRQMQQMLMGEVRDWSKVGGPAMPVTMVTIDGRSFGERATRVLMPGDRALQASQRLRDDAAVLDAVRNNFGAVGLVRLAAADGAPGIQLLAIDGVQPGVEAFTEGYYPFASVLQVVGNGDTAGPAAMLLELLRAPAARQGAAAVLTPMP